MQNTNTTLLVVTMVIAALGPLIAALVAYIQSRSAISHADEAKKTAQAMSMTVNEIKTEVNHDRTVMMEELRKLREENVALSKDKSKFEERERGSEITKALSTTPAAAMTEEQIAIIVARILKEKETNKL